MEIVALNLCPISVAIFILCQFLNKKFAITVVCQLHLVFVSSYLPDTNNGLKNPVCKCASFLCKHSKCIT